MSIGTMVDDWTEKKVANLKSTDKLVLVKAFGYGMIAAIPDGLAIIGATVLCVAGLNFCTGKGFRIYPKD